MRGMRHRRHRPHAALGHQSGIQRALQRRRQVGTAVHGLGGAGQQQQQLTGAD